MATTIQIDEKTKALLDKLKVHYRQSYNEIIEKIAKENLNKGNKDIMAFAGAWGHLSDKEIDEMKNNIAKLRRRSTLELMRKYKK